MRVTYLARFFTGILWFLGLGSLLISFFAGTVRAGDPPVPATDPIEIQLDRYGFEWCVIGDVDNPPFPGKKRNGAFKGAGVVPYRYRMTRTELSTTQYVDFLRTYWPYYDGNPLSSDFTGAFIFARWEGDEPVYEAMPNYAEVPTTISLRMAARYCNWLHNDKITEEWAFESGVYDTSTFGRNPDGSYSDDYTPAAAARYWIPNMDEWLKAGYYDPNHGGPGQGGWWDMPNGTDCALVIGFPGDFGQVPTSPPDARANFASQTNASLDNFPAKGMSAGSYPWVESPWGLRDVSGGISELALPWEMGSSIFFLRGLISELDSAGTRRSSVLRSPTWSSRWGLRLASPIPSQISP